MSLLDLLPQNSTAWLGLATNDLLDTYVYGRLGQLGDPDVAPRAGIPLDMLDLSHDYVLRAQHSRRFLKSSGEELVSWLVPSFVTSAVLEYIHLQPLTDFSLDPDFRIMVYDADKQLISNQVVTLAIGQTSDLVPQTAWYTLSPISLRGGYFVTVQNVSDITLQFWSELRLDDLRWKLS